MAAMPPPPTVTVVPPEPVPGPPAPPSAWDHLSAVLGGLVAVVLGYVDLRTAGALTEAGDAALIVAGLAVLGVKGIVPGVIPRA